MQTRRVKSLLIAIGLLLAVPASAGVSQTTDRSRTTKSMKIGYHQLQCWQNGKLIINERNLTSEMKLIGSSQSGMSLVRQKTGETINVFSVDDRTVCLFAPNGSN